MSPHDQAEPTAATQPNAALTDDDLEKVTGGMYIEPGDVPVEWFD